MVLASQHSYVDEDYQLVVNLDNVKNLSLLLKAVHLSDSATFIATVKGIKVSVEDSQFVEAHAFIQAEVFQHFAIREEQIAFRLSLKAMLECLNIFGNMQSRPTALKMCYQGYGYPLKLLLEEGGVVTDCSIKTQDPFDGLNLAVAMATVNKVIMKAECLRDVLTDLDTSSDLVEMRLAPTRPHFRVATAGTTGLTQIDIPADCDMIESFVCPHEYTFRYKASLVKPLIKMLSIAQKVSLLIDSLGLLGCQIMVSVPPHTCYIEFNCTPSVDDDAEVQDPFKFS